MSKRVGWLAVTVSSLALVSSGCRQNEDLTRAIDGGVGRTISSQPAPAAFQWKSVGALQPDNDTLLRQPVSACWLGEHLAVADEHRQRVVVFDAAGVPVRTIGKRGVKEGEFLEISAIRCSEGRAALLVADGGSRRVSFFDAAGKLLYSVPAPVTPQDPVQLGDFILTSSGDWFDSWLGIRANDGPYLSEEDWRKVKLVRAWSPVGHTRGEFGDPVAYSHPTARRVLNRVFLASVRDTVWLLTQGDAVLRGFGVDGRSVDPPAYLPIYHRGREPTLRVKAPSDPKWPNRINKMLYQPNVSGLAIVHDSLFATLRYYGWSTRLQGHGGNRYIDDWPRTALEVFDRQGRVRSSLALPGKGYELVSDDHSRVAVLVRNPDGSRRLLIGRLPK